MFAAIYLLFALAVTTVASPRAAMSSSTTPRRHTLSQHLEPRYSWICCDTCRAANLKDKDDCGEGYCCTESTYPEEGTSGLQCKLDGCTICIEDCDSFGFDGMGYKTSIRPRDGPSVRESLPNPEPRSPAAGLQARQTRGSICCDECPAFDLNDQCSEDHCCVEADGDKCELCKECTPDEWCEEWFEFGGSGFRSNGRLPYRTVEPQVGR